MKRYFFFALLCTCVLGFAACGDDDDDSPSESDVKIICTPNQINAEADGGVFTVQVSCTGREWTASSDFQWLTTKVSGSTSSAGTVTITVAANPTDSERIGIVVVRSGSVSQVVEVKQNGAAPLQPDDNIVVPEGYSLVWHDEFNEGTSPSTDRNGWYYETGNSGWGNNEIQRYVSGSSHPDICFIENGILNIKMSKVNNEVYSIRMNTNQAWTYGWFEARLRLPKGKGTWPAFWMMPKNFTTWPGDGEIDIMEEVGYNPNYVLSTIHCNKYNNTGSSVESAGRSIATAQSEFHVYACEWTDQFLKFYIDGSLLLTYRNDGTGYDAWPFYTPFYLKLNLAWGGDWGGAQGLDESCLPATYQIDYVRVFQKK